MAAMPVSWSHRPVVAGEEHDMQGVARPQDVVGVSIAMALSAGQG